MDTFDPTPSESGMYSRDGSPPLHLDSWHEGYFKKGWRQVSQKDYDAWKAGQDAAAKQASVDAIARDVDAKAELVIQAQLRAMALGELSAQLPEWTDARDKAADALQASIAGHKTAQTDLGKAQAAADLAAPEPAVLVKP